MLPRFSILPLIMQVRRNKLLPVDSYINSAWSGVDTKELYEKNVKTQPDNWYYKSHTVRYKNNSQGYRTKEFNDIEWDNSIVLFGCSNTYGVGLDEDDTVGSQLTKITGIPTVNLGVGGSSMIYALHNSIIVREQFPTPKAVVYIWPDYSRCVEYHEHSVRNHGPWDMEDTNLMGVWNSNDYNVKMHAVFIQKTVRLLWKDTVLYEGTFSNKATAKLLKCEAFNQVDDARDLMHPGRESTKKAAIKIAKGLGL